MRILLIVWLSLSLLGCNRVVIEDSPKLVLVKWDDRSYGFMNEEGAEIIPAQYAYACKFSEDLAGVNVGGSFRKRKMPKDGKWGFIDITGTFQINPIFYSPPVSGAFYDPDSFALAAHQAYVFSEGLAAVCIEDPSGKGIQWAYIDRKGKAVISNPAIKSARMFKEGLANVYIQENPNRRGRWGYINSYGEIIIEPQFLFPATFHQGYALVINEKKEKMLIDRKGYRYLPQYAILTDFSNGYGTARPFWLGESTNEADRRKTLLVNLHGAPVTEAEFDWIGSYGNQLAPALVGSKMGNPISYPQALSSTAEAGGKWGFIDLKGNFVINPQYENARGFRERLAAVKSGGLWGYLLKDEGMLTKYEFRWAGFFDEGIAAVRLGPIHGDYDGRYAYINKEGNVFWVEPAPM